MLDIGTQTEEATTIGNGEGAVVKKIRTRKGFRLEVSERDGPAVIRLDALETETLTWQSKVDIGNSQNLDAYEDVSEEDGTALFVLRNEFAEVEVAKLIGQKEPLLQIKAPKQGHVVELTAEDLVWIAQQPKSVFSEFLETPFPDDH